MRPAYRRGFTIAEAARALEIPEHAVRARLADGSIRVVGKGPYGANLLDADDVRHLARVNELGELGRRQRLVLVVGDLPEHARALRVAGLTPERHATIMQALDSHDVPGAAIVVATPEAVNQQLWLLEPALGMIHLAVVSDTQTAVPWTVEQRALICDPHELRRLVVWAWSSLDARTRAGALEL